MRKHIFVVATVVLGLVALRTEAQDVTGPARALADSQIRAWIADPMVIDAVKAQNAKHAGLTQAEIEGLDQQWRSETGASIQPLIDSVLNNALSRHLRELKANGRGLFTEIFVMDNKGLNVGQSDITSDYWQGDEDKWQQTYGAGPGAIHISEVELDESSQTFQTQISLPVLDPATGAVIGAITVGVDAEVLTQ